MDMIKVQIQLGSEAGGSTSPFVIAREIMNQGGIKAFYAGLDAALLRQVVYGTLRMGIYFNLTEYFKKQNGTGTTTFLQKASASLIAGSFGSFIGNPCDLSLVRMQADKGLPEAERRNYKSVFDAFSRIISEEGVTSLWKGAVPTIIRATALNVAMLVSYDTVKEVMESRIGKDSPFKVQVSSSMVAAVATAVVSLPFDNIKTKI
jgi:solute carrier family 25 oxoglutarate transporter 11